MAWWLAYDELYGDMDKEYPIMTDKDEHSDSYYDYNRNDVNLDNPFTDPKDRERAEKVVGKYPRQVWPSLKDDCYPTLGSTKEVDDVYAHHFPGTDIRPEPNLKYKSPSELKPGADHGELSAYFEKLPGRAGQNIEKLEQVYSESLNTASDDGVFNVVKGSL